MLFLFEVDGLLDGGLWFSSGLFALVIAYMVRFMAVAFGPVESSFKPSNVHQRSGTEPGSFSA